MSLKKGEEMFGKRFIPAKAISAFALIAATAFSVPALADNITVDGKSRSMLVYAPSGIEKNRPLII